MSTVSYNTLSTLLWYRVSSRQLFLIRFPHITHCFSQHNQFIVSGTSRSIRLPLPSARLSLRMPLHCLPRLLHRRYLKPLLLRRGQPLHTGLPPILRRPHILEQPLLHSNLIQLLLRQHGRAVLDGLAKRRNYRRDDVVDRFRGAVPGCDADDVAFEERVVGVGDDFCFVRGEVLETTLAFWVIRGGGTRDLDILFGTSYSTLGLRRERGLRGPFSLLRLRRRLSGSRSILL